MRVLMLICSLGMAGLPAGPASAEAHRLTDVFGSAAAALDDPSLEVDAVAPPANPPRSPVCVPSL